MCCVVFLLRNNQRVSILIFNFFELNKSDKNNYIYVNNRLLKQIVFDKNVKHLFHQVFFSVMAPKRKKNQVNIEAKRMRSTATETADAQVITKKNLYVHIIFFFFHSTFFVIFCECVSVCCMHISASMIKCLVINAFSLFFFFAFYCSSTARLIHTDTYTPAASRFSLSFLFFLIFFHSLPNLSVLFKQ